MKSYWLTILIGFYFTLVFNLRIESIYLTSYPMEDAGSVLQAIAFFIFVFGINTLILALFSFKYAQKLITIILLLVGAPSLYFALTFNTFFNPSMIRNALETDVNEASDLLSVGYWMMFIILGVIPSIFVFKQPISYPPFFRNLIQNILLIVVTLIVIFIAIAPNYSTFSSFVRNNSKPLKYSLLPLAPIQSLSRVKRLEYLNNNPIQKIKDESAKIIPSLVRNEERPKVLVVIVGETTRASSFEKVFNEFKTNNQYLNPSDNLVYFENTYSCGTNTAASLPCIFSTFTKDSYKRSFKEKYENVAELITRVGYQVTWRNNNSGCKGLCTHIPKDPINMENSSSFAAYNHFYDEALVDDLEQRISSSKKDQVIFLHTMGSHGPAYFKRTPKAFKHYQPACESIEFSDCNNSQIVNAYDNTVVYANHVIATAIKKLDKLSKNYDTGLIYFSDHGESTGEGGYYLHGIPYFMAPEEQIHIPMLTWFSNGLITSQNIDIECLRNKRHQKLSHDNVSHTLLGLLNISSVNYQSKLDLLSTCVK